jgi:hypothetical protein
VVAVIAPCYQAFQIEENRLNLAAYL